MKKSKFTEEQIAFALRQAEAGTLVIKDSLRGQKNSTSEWIRFRVRRTPWIGSIS